MTLDPARLLATVRGRRLLWEVLTHVHTVVPWWGHDTPGEPVPTDDEVLPALTVAATAAAGRTLTDTDLDAALSATVDSARYWQEPERFEAVLARPAVRDALAPVAAVVGAAAPAWWNTPIDRTTQHRVHWVDERPPARGVATRQDVAAWRTELLAGEARFAALHLRPHPPWSGEWWSTPGHRLPSTTRAAAGLPAVHLALVEDESGWTAADVEPVAVDPAARMYEVTAAADWAALVAQHPLEVTHSRRYDWLRATGRRGRWFLPDFAAVAERYDAVHVSVAGYLDTAGEAVPVPDLDGATVLAGWSPDQTWWLAPDLTAAGPAQRWARAPEAWTPWDRVQLER